MRDDADSSALGRSFELDLSRLRGEDGEISAHADVGAGEKLGSSLPDDD